MNKILDIRLAFYLTAGFVLFTALGTLTHEMGHYCAARLLGYEAHINYKVTQSYEVGSAFHSFLITLAGPLETVLSGTIGLLLVLRYIKRDPALDLDSKQWLFIFMALCWLRQLFNFASGFLSLLRAGTFPPNNDEARLAVYFHLWPPAISVVSAGLAAVVLAILFFRFIPVRQRITFILSGLLGGALGYYMWFSLLGPVLMP